jgi:hypothetical protein
MAVAVDGAYDVVQCREGGSRRLSMKHDRREH